MSDCDYDVVIVGGGMVGASLAVSLSRRSEGAIRVLLVERFPMKPHMGDGPPPYRPSFDARSTALSYGSQLIFESLGLWQALSRHACAIDRVHVSDRGHFGSVCMTAEEQGWPALGSVIENPWLGSVLLAAVGRASGVQLRSPATLSEVNFCSRFAALTLQTDGDTERVTTQLLVVADGADSDLRRSLGIEADVHSYRQTAFIANVATERPHEGCAFERFTEYGALALLPLSRDEQGQSRSALVWTFRDALLGPLEKGSDREFLARLQQDFGYRLGRLLKVGERVRYPLHLTRACEQVRRHVVVMGNAAHSLHPVAGQGFNLALREVAGLAELLVAAHRRGEALGQLGLLERYAENHARDQWLTSTFSDRLTSVFGNRQPLLSLVRNLGLTALDVLPPAKARFVARNAGMAAGDRA